MAAQIVAIADAIAAEMKEKSDANAFALPFTIIGRNDSDDLATFRVWERLEGLADAGVVLRVFPQNAVGEQITRGKNQFTCTIALCFQAKAKGVVTEEALAEVGEQVADYWTRKKRPDAYPGANVRLAEFSPLIDAESLRTSGVLTMVATLTILAWREG